MMPMLAMGLAVVIAIVLMPQGSAPAEAAQKGKSSSAKAGPKAGSTGPIVTGRFGLKTYDVRNPAPRAGKKKGETGN